MKTKLLAAGLVSLATMAGAEVPVLTVLTYDSFATEWGPGPAVKAGFEKTCGCEVKYLTAGDGAAILARLKLEGANSAADVVVGLDTGLTADASATGFFAPVVSPPNALPVPYSDPLFVPFDWGWFAFVYDKTKLAVPPGSLKELAASDLKIIIEDPRSSTPGLGLLMWVKAAYGDGAAQVWADLADNIVTVTPGWSEAYGLFLQGESDLVLSYTTSPAYHLIAESDDSKAAAKFTEGHYLQVEVAGQLVSSKQPKLAAEFLAYLTGPEGQAVIPTTNWMYPANPATDLPEGFGAMIKPEKSLLFSAQEASETRAAAIVEWQTALSR